MDIGMSEKNAASLLSNFQEYHFIIDEVECNSMEGLLQSFKFSDQEKQKKVCKLIGKKAKFTGKKKKWFIEQTLYWKGVKYDRHSKEYQELLDRAFDELSKNKEFQKALLDTGDEKLTHSIGKKDPHGTVLTEDEFCERLMNIRKELKNGS